MTMGSYARSLRIWETNYGRQAGWVVERLGQPIAVLTECRAGCMRPLPPCAAGEEFDRLYAKTFDHAPTPCQLVWQMSEFGWLHRANKLAHLPHKAAGVRKAAESGTVI